MDGRNESKIARIKKRLLMGEEIKTENSSPHVLYTSWVLASRSDVEHYLDAPIPGERYVIASTVYADPTGFDAAGPWLRPVDEAAEIIASLAEVR